MKITFVGHASILIETKGLRVLSDPWWRGPCFGAQWWTYPLPDTRSLEGQRIDYIYISHGHHDHFHPATLRTLNRETKVLISRKTDLAGHLKRLGFDVIELDDDQVLTLAQGVTCRIMETHLQDTLMCLDDGDEVCINLNDAMHASPQSVQTDFIAQLKKIYPRIDYVFCGHGVASHFPNCYQIPGKNGNATAARRVRHFNREWAKIIAGLGPRFGFPFAADVVFLESDLFWANEPVHNTERPTDVFLELYPGSTVKTLDISPGFVIEDGDVVEARLRRPVWAADIRAAHSASIARVNRYSSVDSSGIQEIAALVQNNLDICGDYLKTFSGDYRFLIRFRNSPLAIRIEKSNMNLSSKLIAEDPKDSTYDLIFTTRLAYLKQSLTMPYGHEVLFVGSGGVFKYADQAKVGLNLHREFVQLLKKHDRPPAARHVSASKVIDYAKRGVKRLIGRREEDLYDLGYWTVFDEKSEYKQGILTHSI